MESSSPPASPPNAAREIFQMLLASAIGRCQAAGILCRLSISLKCCYDSDPPCVKISVSDTGVGSSLEEFKSLEDLLRDLPYAASAEWDGVLFVTTTGIHDKEVFRHRLGLLEEAGASKLTRLPAALKMGKRFSGTEVLFSVEPEDGVSVFSKWVGGIVRQVSVLRIPTVAFLLESEHVSNQGTKAESISLESYVLQTLPNSNIERLTFGLRDYVQRHGNALEEICESCFSSCENLKFGNGLASCARKQQIVEAVVVVTTMPSTSINSCPWASTMKNEVLYFNDHLPCTSIESPCQALESIDWHCYGFSLEALLVEEGHIVLKCENLLHPMKIFIAIHCYPMERPQVGKNLVKKAVVQGLNDLKMKHKGLFLSARAQRIQRHVPDLSSAIAGLITASNDQAFQHTCASLLGLHPLEIRTKGKVLSCIQEKVNGIIEMNDGKKDAEDAPHLFECKNITGKNHDGGCGGDMPASAVRISDMPHRHALLE